MKTSYGTGRNKDDARLCVKEASESFKDPKLIFFFSGEDHFPEYAEIIHEMFPDAVSIGCSSYRNFNVSGTERVVLDMLAVEDGIICSGGAIEKVDNFVMGSAGIVRDCLDEVGETENTVCVEFTTASSRAEEFALMALNSVLLRNEIPVVGGTSGNVNDIPTGQIDSYVALNGKVYTEGCAFVIIHNLGGKIHIFRENIYEPLTGRELTVTKANSMTRTVMTCNGLTAVEAYANELGVDSSEIQNYFFEHPIGRREGDETFVTAIFSVGSGGSMKHLARLHEGTKVMVMKKGDYREILKQDISKIKSIVPEPSCVLTVQCVACTILFENENYIDEYQKNMISAFSKGIGFSAFGEQMGTKHFNHTILIIVFE